jgi:hypothetical protein
MSDYREGKPGGSSPEEKEESVELPPEDAQVIADYMAYRRYRHEVEQTGGKALSFEHWLIKQTQ